MAGALGTSGSNGVAFLVAGGIVYEIIAFACSSPQTAEINIRTREGTLMKWVHLGQLLAAAFVVTAAVIDRQHRGAIIAGGLVAMGSAEAFYLHARSAGLSKPGPETEQQYGRQY